MLGELLPIGIEPFPFVGTKEIPEYHGVTWKLVNSHWMKFNL